MPIDKPFTKQRDLALEIERDKKVSYNEAWRLAGIAVFGNERLANKAAREASPEFANAQQGESQAEARERIAFRARSLATSGGVSFANALRTICSINPGLTREAGLNTTQAQTEFANAIEQGVGGNVLTGARQPDTTSQTENGLDLERILKMGLPNDATKAEFDAANSVDSSDLAKVWVAMTQLAMRSFNVDLQAAGCYCMGRYPRLFKAATAAGLIKTPTMHSSQGTSRAA